MIGLLGSLHLFLHLQGFFVIFALLSDVLIDNTVSPLLVKVGDLLLPIWCLKNVHCSIISFVYPHELTIFVLLHFVLLFCRRSVNSLRFFASYKL